MFRAFNKGALGMLKSAARRGNDIYSGKEVDECISATIGEPSLLQRR